MRVHSGGPPITRKLRDIYSEPALSKGQAAIVLQCWHRRLAAHSALDIEWLRHFTSNAEGCRAVRA